MKTNKVLFFLWRKYPNFYNAHFRGRAHARASIAACKRLCKVLDEQMDEAWGWDEDREYYDELLELKIRYEDIIQSIEEDL